MKFGFGVRQLYFIGWQRSRVIASLVALASLSSCNFSEFSLTLKNPKPSPTPISTEVVSTPTPAPSDPASLVATASSASVLLNWSSSTGAGAITYDVYRSTTSGSYGSPLVSGISSATYTDSTPVAGTSYYYVVKASNSGGVSNGSNEASVRPIAAFSISSVAVNGASSLQVSWGSAIGASSYTLKYGTASGTYGTLVSASATSPSTVSGLNPATTYYFMVTASNTVGAGTAANASAEATGVPLAAFTISSVTQPTSGQANVAWNASTGSASYTVKYGTTSGTYGTSVSTTATSPQNVTGLSNGTAYYFMVYAVNPSGSLPATTEGTLTPVGAPSAPTTLTATGGISNIALSWTASTGGGSITYDVYRSTTSGSYGAALATGQSGTTYSDLTALNGTTYYYTVKAINTGGTSSASNEASARPISSFTISAVAVNATSGGSALQVSWAAATGASAYTLKYGTSTGTYGTTVSTSATSPTVVSSLTPGTTYYFMVVATNAVGGGASVNATSEMSGVPMAAFTLSSVTQTGLGQDSVAWASSAGSTSYTLKYGTASGTYGTTVSTSATSPTTVSSLTSGTTYYFMVYAVNGSGTLPATAEMSTTPYAAPAAPTSLTATYSNGSVNLSWTAASGSGTITYDVQRSTTSGSGYSTISTAQAGTTYTDSNPTDGTTYYYVVTASNIAGTSSNSNEASKFMPSISQSAVSLSASTLTVSATSTVTLALKDAGGTTKATATGYTVSFTTTGGGTFGSVTDNSNGTYSATFTAAATSPGTYTIGAKIGTPAVTSTQSITITPGAVAGLAFTSQPNSSLSAGTNFTSVQVTLYDSNGNVATNAASTVDLLYDNSNCNDGGIFGGSGSVTAVAPTSGVVTFSNVAPTMASTGFCLLASVTGTAIVTATSSNTFDVTAGTATKLVFSSQPSGAQINTSIAPSITVSIADTYGNVVTGASASITVAIGTNPGAGTLSGTTTQATSSGVATFSNLSISTAGNGYTLTASGGGYTGATSDGFNILNTTPVNLESAIELVDAGITPSSGTGTMNLRITATTFDPSLYDGTVTYTFEIVAKNTDSVARNVYLTSRPLVSGCSSSVSNLTTVATISVPVGATDTRYTTTISPAAGIYFLQTDKTTGNPQLKISVARIIVKQVGATRTRIYVPLSNDVENTFGGSSSSADVTSNTTYTQGSAFSYTRWKKESSLFGGLAATNPFTFETVTSSNIAGVSVSAVLRNATTGNDVAGSTTTTSSTNGMICSQPLSTSATNFTDDDEFEVYIKSSNSNANARIHRAGIWITLQGITKLLTYNRVSRQAGATGASNVLTSRHQLNTSNFTSPTTYFECSGYYTTSGLTVSLMDNGTNDSGTTGATAVTSSGLTLTSSKSRSRTGALTITSGDRFYIRSTGSGVLGVSSCLAIIKMN